MLDVSHNMEAFERSLSDALREQLPYAMSVAMNEAAQSSLEAVRNEMQRAFDRPTRWTLNAFRIRYARKRDLNVSIQRKSVPARRFYLETQEEGGVRPQTALERLLSSRLAYSGNIRTVTPASGARLNVSGNMSPGQRNQVLSAIRSQRDSSANTSEVSRARNRGRAQYFVPRGGSRLSPGVWTRTSRRGGIRKVWHFSERAARYRAIFHFNERAERAFRENFERNLVRSLREAWQTRRR